jgi:tRNA dimethylallyltransferase
MTSNRASSSRPPQTDNPTVIALYGPTASGKSAVAEALLRRLDAEVVSADSAALYAGLPILTAAPDHPARLVGTVPLSEEVSVGSYQQLAHEAIDEIVAAGRAALVVGGTGLYLRAALSSLELPPPPAEGVRERWERTYDAGSEAAYATLAARDPAAAERIHPNDRRRVVRALELNEIGSSLAPSQDQLWTAAARHPTLVVGLDLPLEELDARIEVRTRRMADAGAAVEARRAWQEPLSQTARNVLGLEAFATLPEDEAVVEVIRATRRLARYQRKWQRKLAAAATLAAGRAPEEIADDIAALRQTALGRAALGRTGKHLSGR